MVLQTVVHNNDHMDKYLDSIANERLEQVF